MRADQADGLPAIGETGRYLGVRPGVDIPVAPDGFVDSGTEGMSVVPPPVENLVDHRIFRGYWLTSPTLPTRRGTASSSRPAGCPSRSTGGRYTKPAPCGVGSAGT
jgi:hypothetical protein